MDKTVLAKGKMELEPQKTEVERQFYEALAKRKTELESQQAEVEKQLSYLERKRMEIKEQLIAVGILLHLPINLPNQGQVPEKNDVRNTMGELDELGEFMLALRAKGWFIEEHGRKPRIYLCNRGGKTVELWLKFSKRHEASGQYWFGLNADRLENKSGGVILLLDTHEHYVCLPFLKLREILEGAKNTETGQKFQIRQNGGQVELQPTGSNRKWFNVSSYYNGEGLQKIGIN